MRYRFGGSRRLTFSKKKYRTTTNGTIPRRAPTQLRLDRRLTAYAPNATAVHAKPHSATCGNASGSLNHRLLNASTLSAGGSICSSAGGVVAAGSLERGSIGGGPGGGGPGA